MILAKEILPSLPRICFGLTTLGTVTFLLTLPMVDDLRRAYLKKKKREALPIVFRFSPPPWSISSSEVCGALKVNPGQGLSDAEAKTRLARHGENVIDPVILPGFMATFVKEIYEPTQLLLLLIGVLYATFGSADEAVVCFFVILAMASAEVATEWRAKRAVATLKTAVPRRALVVREQRRIRIPQQHVVPGDVVLLQAGMEVPADLRLLDACFLEVDESSTTGESTPVPKDALSTLPVGARAQERANVVLAGSVVTRGTGRGVVYATGARTDAGTTLKVARKGRKEKKTTLQTLLKQVAGTLTIVALGLSAVGALLGLVQGMGWKHILLTGLSLAFATIPEELPILIAAVLAVGAKVLSVRNIYVKQLRAAENLGYVDTVLTDKTGTLTENRLTLKRVVVGSESFSPDMLTGSQLPTDVGEAGLARLLDAWLHMSSVGDELAGDYGTEGTSAMTPLQVGKESGGVSTPQSKMTTPKGEVGESVKQVKIETRGGEETEEDLEAPLLGSGESEGAKQGPLSTSEGTGEDGDPFDRAVLQAIGGIEVLGGGVPAVLHEGKSPDTQGGLTASHTFDAAAAVGEFYRQKVTSRLLAEVPFDAATKSSSRMFRSLNPPSPSPTTVAASPPLVGGRGRGQVYQAQTSRVGGKSGRSTGERRFFKGAPESLLASCQFFAQGDDDVAAADLRGRMQEQIQYLAAQGLRLIGYAVKDEGKPSTPQGLEIRPASPPLDLCAATFLGALAFEDPVRLGASDAVRSCQVAGVRVIMVTGDHSQTAAAVARKVGILHAQQGGESIVSCLGDNLGDMDDARLDNVVNCAHVFARATPTDKLAILRALQRQGRVVVATGDGTNDGPVLATADVGMAMGTSTDVAREACGIVILDDDFSSLVTAIAEGRRLLANLRKALAFYLGAKAGLVLLFVVGTLYSRFPLAAIQILVLELFMDVGASSSFVLEPSEDDAMIRPPRPLSSPFFDTDMLRDIATAAISIFAGVITSFICGLSYGHGGNSLETSSPEQTMAFLGWLFAHVFLALNMRSTNLPILLQKPFSNPGMNLWLILSFLTAALVAFVPLFRDALKLQTLPFRMWLAVLSITLVSTFWIEILKILRAWRRPSHNYSQQDPTPQPPKHPKEHQTC